MATGTQILIGLGQILVSLLLASTKAPDRSESLRRLQIFAWATNLLIGLCLLMLCVALCFHAPIFQ